MSNEARTASDLHDEAHEQARYQIGEVADRTGVTQRTLRFYEEKGLLTPADRMDGGFRLYSDADIGRIRLIKQLQTLLGFSLAEIKEMVESEEIRASIRQQRQAQEEQGTVDPAAARARARQALDALHRQLAVVEPKLTQLEELRADLVDRIGRVERRLADLDRELQPA